MNNTTIEKFLLLAVETSKLAGNIIMSFYRKQILTEIKNDGSPLTKADLESNKIIMNKLKQSNIPIVSEESIDLVKKSPIYWLVDPLDGTKDFLACNDEFTVNISLIHNNYPIIGVIYAPALDELYISSKITKTHRIKNKIREYPKANPKSKNLVMARSRFHDNEKAYSFYVSNKVTTSTSIGSALKYGRIVFGEVDVYPRYVGTSEWDTAAGQSILEASGGSMIDLVSGSRMKYGKRNRRNNSFIAFRNPYELNDFKY
tara:strand:+ start:314 stop:1090 length:777 start_codon:yes stop_codon:yes gene_type:complete